MWQQIHFLWMWYSPKCCQGDAEETNFEVVIFVFFVYKKYSCSFVKLRLNHWWHMDYFNNVLTTFLGLECVSCIAVYGGSESSRNSQKYLHLCSEDERRSYGFGTTWGWVINDRIFGWTISLIIMVNDDRNDSRGTTGLQVR